MLDGEGDCYYWQKENACQYICPSSSSWVTRYGGEVLGIPSQLLGCHCSCCRGKSGSGECGLLPGSVRGGRHGVVGFFRLLGGERGCGSAVFSLVPSYTEASGAGAPRASVMDVSVIMQLMFLQSHENAEAPQIPFLTECYRFQLYHRFQLYEQGKLCKSRRFNSEVLGQVVHAPVVLLRQVLGVGQCRITVEVPQLPDIEQFFRALSPDPEQVIEVPKILPFDVPTRSAVRVTQLVEQLVEVPTIISYSSLQRTVEHYVDIPVPGGEFRSSRFFLWTAFNSVAFIQETHF